MDSAQQLASSRGVRSVVAARTPVVAVIASAIKLSGLVLIGGLRTSWIGDLQPEPRPGSATPARW